MTEADIPAGRDAVDSLVTDHRLLLATVSQLQSAIGGPGAAKLNGRARSIANRLVEDYRRHCAHESELLGSAARPAGESGGTTDTGVDDWTRTAMRDLRALPIEDPRLGALVVELEAHVRDHVQRQEADVFPTL